MCPWKLPLSVRRVKVRNMLGDVGVQTQAPVMNPISQIPVGFIHPAQIELLNKEAVGTTHKSQDGTGNLDADVSFWSGEHKLGISSEVLFPLYKVARNAFMESLTRYKTLEKITTESENIDDSSMCYYDGVESEVMKHSRALLLLSCDFGTAWNSRDWAGFHVADNSCFNYRRQLMLRISEDLCQETESSVYFVKAYDIWKEELDWNEKLITRYIGREALWLHRRFLTVYWIQHLPGNDDIGTFLDNELRLLNSCTSIQDHEFDDFQAQRMHSAAYMLWLTKHVPPSPAPKIRLQIKLKTLLDEACPERSSLWNSITDSDLPGETEN